MHLVSLQHLNGNSFWGLPEQTVNYAYDNCVQFYNVEPEQFLRCLNYFCDYPTLSSGACQVNVAVNTYKDAIDGTLLVLQDFNEE